MDDARNLQQDLEAAGVGSRQPHKCNPEKKTITVHI